MLLAQTLLRQIEAGTFPEGALLPAESALERQFGVSRITVRSALAELESQGIVSRRPGVGTRVLSARPAGVFVHAGSSIDDVLQFTQGLPFHTLSTEPLEVGPALAAEMALPRGQHVLKVSGVRRSPEGLPMMYSEHYIPALYAEVVRAFEGYQASIAELVARHGGQGVEEIRQQVGAIKLTAATARTLHGTAGAPCLRTRRWYFTRDGALIMAACSLFPADRFVFTSVLRRASPAV